MLDSPEKGSIYVFTGDGKGKTTAAIGQAVRAIGQEWQVLMVQFIKKWISGEVPSLQKLGVEVYPMGLGFVGIMGDTLPRSDHEAAARKALSFVRKKVKNGSYRLLILDEVNVAVSLGLIDVRDVLGFLKDRPPNLNVILTGRGAPAEFVEIADLVSEVREVKHPFSGGVKAKRGIEY
ncbi:MAG TPA: cob(I)yrinic acid a,c-diamide adenosyltransferase [Patescibacteria group bacterium]|nr:cob(I)yrinic acid a,c-diamide adenosyltransferase [Patescibacteria group bacterium]